MCLNGHFLFNYVVADKLCCDGMLSVTRDKSLAVAVLLAIDAKLSVVRSVYYMLLKVIWQILPILVVLFGVQNAIARAIY